MGLFEFLKRTRESELAVEVLEANTAALELKVVNLKKSKEELGKINSNLVKMDKENNDKLDLLESKILALTEEILILQVKGSEEIKEINEKLHESESKEAENYKLFKKIQGFFGMTTEELEKLNKEFPVSFDEDERKWTYTTAICSLGGCEYEYKSFESQREALISANIIQERGVKVNTKSACGPCYREMLEDCM